jgi:ABC-type phosphate/phosphonate transport system substrate-binding protein
MLAALAMYDFPELAAATDAWWAGLRRHLEDAGFANVPPSLDRNLSAPDQWRSRDLIFAQTCGYPFTHAFQGGLALLGTPCYEAPGCAGPTYSSAIVVNAASRAGTIEDLRGATVAFNTPDSFSGHLALRSLVAPLARAGRFFAQAIETGSHARSMELVANAEADIAAIDCVTYALAKRHRPAVTARLRLLAWGPAAPALPYVTSTGWSPPQLTRLRRALIDAVADPDLATPRAALLIGGIELLAEDAYRRILALEAAADSHGYTGLG